MSKYSFVAPSYSFFKESWPKYLGTLLIRETCQNNNKKELKNIQIGSSIEFNSAKLTGRMYKPKKFFDEPHKWTFSVDKYIYNIVVFKSADGKKVHTTLRHKYNEIWSFLARFNYVMIEGEVVQNDYLDQTECETDEYYCPIRLMMVSEAPRFITIKLTVFLMEEFQINPINLALKKYGVPKDQNLKNIAPNSKINHALEETKLENKEFGKLCKESLVVLFDMLNVKRITPTLITLRKKTVLLDALRIKKYGVNTYMNVKAPLDDRLCVSNAELPVLKSNSKFQEYYEYERDEKEVFSVAEQIKGVKSKKSQGKKNEDDGYFSFHNY